MSRLTIALYLAALALVAVIAGAILFGVHSPGSSKAGPVRVRTLRLGPSR